MLKTMLDVPRKRPGLVTAIAILLGIHGLGLFILGVLALLAVITGGKINVFGTTALGSVVDILAVTCLVEGLILLYLAWGLWTLKRWAYWTTLALELLNVLASSLALLEPQPQLWQKATWEIALSLTLSLVILICFLVGSNLRAAFRI